MEKADPFKSQYGFAPILILIFAAILAGSYVLVVKNTSFKQADTTPDIVEESTKSAEVKASPRGPSVSESPLPTIPGKAASNPTKTSSPNPSPIVTPTPQVKTITVSGFAYEDRTNDGIFNSDDPKIPYMQFLIYDSASNEWINTIYSGQDGLFSVTNTVSGNLILKPTCNNNFCPKDGQKEFSSSSAGLQFAFRSASAPTGSNNGVIEGDLIIEGDRPYKFYLLDKNNNYYSNIDWEGGHFKIQNLHNDRIYIIRISYGDGSPDDTEVTLTPSSSEKRTIQVRVRK